MLLAGGLDEEQPGFSERIDTYLRGPWNRARGRLRADPAPTSRGYGPATTAGSCGVRFEEQEDD